MWCDESDRTVKPADERLIETRDSIAEIATSLGYMSEYAFAAAFKRKMGCPPRRYLRETSRVLFP
ncbi:AraC family transcriptional regulator [Stappia sp. MMSF_3263]|uniref:helix-turn-helix domain-containing protein n=1 Tax=Stappia sp. MMSF_3263 TaxID=3046693 RepID=UPI00273F0722|nr:AraC family transcriptional regulator [Stappia sp. MMSF_3263]